MESKKVVTKSRKWNNPNILAWVNDEEVGVAMKLDDFIVALAHEIGDIKLGMLTRTLTQAEILAKIQAASVAVEAEMHKKSSTVV